MGEYAVPMHPSISAGWLIDSLAKLFYTEEYLIKRWRIPAPHEALNAQTIQIKGLEKTMSDVFLQITLLNGSSFTYLIKPVRPYVLLNLEKRQSPPVWEYIQLGIFHIWSGFDHLLFVLGLLLLVTKRSKLLWTITAFTTAHSITLALATLQIVQVPSAFTEAAIAMSIVFLAVELVNHYRGNNGFAYRYPWLVAFLFGLLHGLGFAGALQDVGLPQNNISLALLLFNVGVELGQLAFVMVMVLIIAGISKLHPAKLISQKYIVPYCIGTLAAFWTIERIWELFKI
jgi:hydrogenase/urease accessory protein HupE